MVLLLFFTQLVADAVGGVHLQQGAYQQRHHPVVVEDIDVVGIARDGLGKPGLEEVVAVLDHEYAGADEAGQGEKLDAAQTAQRDAGALIALARLHGGEEQTSRQHQEADKALEDEEHIAAGTRHHQHAAGEEEEGLCLT